jgi:hypothetical protein
MSDPSINVETGGLRSFAEDMRFEADEVLNPAVTNVKAALGDGVLFGANNTSGAVLAAKQQYANALASSQANLTEFIAAAKIFAAAAEQVAKEFDAVDTRSEDAVNRVNGILYGATQQLRAEEAAAAAARTGQGQGNGRQVAL